MREGFSRLPFETTDVRLEHWETFHVSAAGLVGKWLLNDPPPACRQLSLVSLPDLT